MREKKRIYGATWQSLAPPVSPMHRRRTAFRVFVPLFAHAQNDDNDDDRVKTGCVGILLPLVVAALGMRMIILKRTFGGRGPGSPTVGPQQVRWRLSQC